MYEMHLLPFLVKSVCVSLFCKKNVSTSKNIFVVYNYFFCLFKIIILKFNNFLYLPLTVKVADHFLELFFSLSFLCDFFSLSSSYALISIRNNILKNYGKNKKSIYLIPSGVRVAGFLREDLDFFLCFSVSSSSTLGILISSSDILFIYLFFIEVLKILSKSFSLYIFFFCLS